jgi:hypothetical protein
MEQWQKICNNVAAIESNFLNSNSNEKEDEETPTEINVLELSPKRLSLDRSGDQSVREDSEQNNLMRPPDSESIAAATKRHKLNGAKRRTRTKYDERQIEILEATFRRTHYPEVSVVDRLSNLLNLTPERISVWFQNKRAKSKREKKVTTNEETPDIIDDNMRIKVEEILHGTSLVKPSEKVKRRPGKQPFESIQQLKDMAKLTKDETKSNDLDQYSTSSLDNTQEANTDNYENLKPTPTFNNPMIYDSTNSPHPSYGLPQEGPFNNMYPVQNYNAYYLQYQANLEKYNQELSVLKLPIVQEADVSSRASRSASPSSSEDGSNHSYSSSSVVVVTDPVYSSTVTVAYPSYQYQNSFQFQNNLPYFSHHPSLFHAYNTMPQNQPDIYTTSYNPNGF